jgi:hypothetical protein|tara:strand:- start:787 stop:984 length:198 start_codon:yes stop_codon:yes gene_type:complete
MDKFLNTVGGLLIVIGLMAMAGSANDCDGKCIETANTMSEMLTIVIMGLASMGLGAYVLTLVNNK